MPAESYAGYGTALRLAASVRLTQYDRETLCSFIADLFRKDFNDVETHLEIVAQATKGRR